MLGIKPKQVKKESDKSRFTKLDQTPMSVDKVRMVQTTRGFDWTKENERVDMKFAILWDKKKWNAKISKLGVCVRRWKRAFKVNVIMDVIVYNCTRQIEIYIPLKIMCTTWCVVKLNVCCSIPSHCWRCFSCNKMVHVSSRLKFRMRIRFFYGRCKAHHSSNGRKFRQVIVLADMNACNCYFSSSIRFSVLSDSLTFTERERNRIEC